MKTLLGVVSVVVLLAGCSTATLPEPAPEPEVVEEVTPAPEVVEEETEAPEEVELTEEDARTLVYPVVFDSTRLGFIEILGELYSVESVDSYVYDPETGTVQLDATSTFLSQDNVRDAAWEITRLFGSSVYSTLDDGGSWLLDSPRFAPALRVTLSSEVAYECDGETMRLLGDVQLSRDNWESTCRVR
jgi:hypothetical protein